MRKGPSARLDRKLTSAPVRLEGRIIGRAPEHLEVVVTIIVALVCFVGGSAALAQWLPDMADGRRGAIAFFAVCGLGGAALALVGLNIDDVARYLTEHGLSGNLRTDVVTNGLISIFRDAGTVAALALIAYLLAPLAPEEPSRASLPDAPS